MSKLLDKQSILRRKWHSAQKSKLIRKTQSNFSCHLFATKLLKIIIYNMHEEKNMTKEEREEGKVILFAITIVTVVYIIYNEFYKRKLEEKNNDLEKQVETKESQIKMQEMIIKEKTNQLISIISKIRPAESPSSWQRTKESSEEI